MHQRGLLLNRSGQDLHVWSPAPYWDDCDLPTVVGPPARINEWLEEVGLAREGIRVIAGGTGFSFDQVLQSIDADGPSLATGVETALVNTVTFLGSGTGAISGGAWAAGRAIRIHFVAALSSAASSPGNFNLNVRQNGASGTSAGAQTAYALATSLSGSRIALDANLVCRGDTSGGNLETCVEYSPGTTRSSGPNSREIAGTNIGGFDTTANQFFTVSGLFSAWVSGDSVTAKILTLEVMN